jgi:organic hydroperoxide reductase OsmC/OhrA
MAAHVYKATVAWSRGDGEFAKGRYSRAHAWRFDGGIEVPASASPQVVPKPYVVEAAVDPEEAFIASLSSCHMLTFLDLARRAGFVIESYEDEAEGVMEKNTAGKYWISRVTLRPRIAWGGDKQPSQDYLARLHHVAHEECFIANSVKTDVNVEGF